jgi:hypothetical protein
VVNPDLNFETPQHWVRLHEGRNCDPPTDSVALEHWIHLQYVPTRQDADIDEAIDRLLKRHVGLNARWLAVDGESTIGKSEAITAILLRRAMAHPDRWYQRGDTGALHVPYVYVVATSPSTLDLLRDICEFLGLPTEGKEHEVLKRLKKNLSRLGTILIVVDEAQMFRRKSAGASTVTDNLRNVLHLSVPFVFVGVDLGASALLRDWGVNNDTARQLRRRHDLVPLQRLTGPTGVAQIKEFVTAFGRQMLRVKGLRATGLSDPIILTELAIRSEGRPGTMLETLKNAAVLAIHADGDISTQHLNASLPPEPSVPCLREMAL